MPATGATAQTLSRGLDVLRVVAESPEGSTVAQVVDRLGLSRTIVYRLLATLIDHGYVQRDEESRYRVGLAALRLFDNLHPLLREVSRDSLIDLASAVGATAHLCVADGDAVLAVAVVEPASTTFHVAYRVGSRTPMGRGAVGLAIAAAARGEDATFLTEGQLIPGAVGVASAISEVPRLAAAVGVITLAGADTDLLTTHVEAAATAIRTRLAAPHPDDGNPS